jgi:hypothetical protein
VPRPRPLRSGPLRSWCLSLRIGFLPAVEVAVDLLVAWIELPSVQPHGKRVGARDEHGEYGDDDQEKENRSESHTTALPECASAQNSAERSPRARGLVSLRKREGRSGDRNANGREALMEVSR